MSSTLYSPQGQGPVESRNGPASKAIHEAWLAVGGEVPVEYVTVEVVAGRSGYQDALIPAGKVDAFVRQLVSDVTVEKIIVNLQMAFKKVTI